MIPLKSLLIGIASVAGVVGLILFYKRKNVPRSKEDSCKVKMKMNIPNICVPYIFGKYGCVLKALQDKCSTRFSFTPPGILDDQTKVVIKGDPENVRLAQAIIGSVVKIFTHELRTGVDLENILEKCAGFNDSSLSIGENEILTEILKLLSPNNQSNAVVEQESIVAHLQDDVVVQHISDYIHRTQKLVSVGGDKRIPVYISSVAYPSQFWVQALCTKEHGELDIMTQDMYDYFDFNPELNFPPEYETIKVGNLYAVFVEDKKNWYRAEVVTIEPKNEIKPQDTIIDLFFLDFGHSSYTRLKDIRILPIGFLELNFQAIECCAANIKPIGGQWSDKSVDHFESLTQSGIWYKIHAIIEDYCEDTSTKNPVPCVTLIDTNNDDLNINNAMVEAGFAQYST